MNELVKKIQNTSMSASVWECFPLGMTEYQIKHFVLSDREYPTDAAKYRQTVRELHTRWDAYWADQDRLDQIKVERIQQQAIVDFSSLHLLRGIKGMWKARRMGAELRLAQMGRQETALTYHLEHCIVREANILLTEAARLAPPNPQQEYSVESEAKMWSMIPKRDKKGG